MKEATGALQVMVFDSIHSTPFPDSRIVVVFVQSKLILNCLPLPFIAWGYTELQNLSAGNLTQLFHYLK